MAEPAGLGMSLDDLIAKQQTQHQRESAGYGKQQRRTSGGGRGAGRQGGRGGGAQQGGAGRSSQAGGGARHGRQQGGSGGGRGQQQQQQRDDYRNHQRCFQEGDDVVVKFRLTEVVRIDAAGNITLTSGGYHNAATLASLNDALNLLGIRVTCPSGDVASGEWSISDGRTLTRFTDGVVLPAKGQQHAGRARQLLVAFNSPNHAQQAAAAAASNAAATAAGVLPFLGFVPPGVPSNRPVVVARAPANGGSQGGRGSVFSRLGSQPQDQQQRFTPY